MIADIVLALSYWILGVLFAVSAFCAVGCMASLFVSVLGSFRSPMRILGVPLWAVFSFASLGACWLLKCLYTTMGDRTDHVMHYWFLVGMMIPGVMGFVIVPLLVRLAMKRESD